MVLLCACGCGAWCVVQAQHRQHGEEGQLFNDGLQPLVCPAYKDEQRDAAGARGTATAWHWRRAGEQVCHASPYRHRAAPGAAAASAALRKAAGRKPKREFGKNSSQQSCGTGLYALTFTLVFAQAGEYCSAGGSVSASCQVTRHHITSLRTTPLRTRTCNATFLRCYQATGWSAVARCEKFAGASLCRTLAGHTCDLLTITDFSASAARLLRGST